MAADQGRYAIYYSPDPRTALARFGRRWLGYDTENGAAVERPTLADFPAQRLADITAEPRRYGFHATLKPPFSLRAGQDRCALADAIESFATQQPEIVAPPLALAAIAGFWALVPSLPCPALDRLAADCVRRFDPFRAPPSEDELARRRRAPLTAAQEALLVRWGYPYVMDQFRFHMTLTARLVASEASRLEAILSPLVAPLCRAELRIDAIGLFHEETPGAPFRLLRTYRLASAASSAGS